MIEITSQISIPENELSFEFVRSGGPGGQKVNKTSSAVLLKFDVRNSPSLTDDIKDRLKAVAGNSLSNDGILVVHSRKYRSQIRNRENAICKLIKLIRKASKKQRSRRATEPTVTSERKRLIQKKKRGMLKKNRNYSPSDNDFQ
ncbi:MAG: aminoacyl-tRNA hydrolase [Candidatus Aegiribacteria sp.]|nr:aminoacyl-tRNA hydrolase [Candidatus Aegiribacteria sp.]